MKNKPISFLFIIIILISVFFLIKIIFLDNKPSDIPKSTNKTIIGNASILSEIDRLLFPLYYRNITKNDFSKLKEQVKEDAYAANETEELIILTNYKEYIHVGHGLAFLHNYVKTGKEQICPGHLLSHYYVFLKHNETTYANSNLKEAKEKLPEWQQVEESHNQTYLTAQNYTFYKNILNQILVQIDKGNSTISDKDIFTLTAAPCAD